MKDIDLIFKNIKNKEFAPIYFFYGEEPYYIDLAVKELENNILTEDEKAFNQTLVYGKDTNYAEILSLARQFPMMGDRQVIIVKEAQDLKLNKDEQEIFLKYVENPVSSTILIFAHKAKLDGKLKITKALNKAQMLHHSEPVKDYQLAKWIQDEFQKQNIKTAPNIAHLLAEYIGNDLSRIANELHKMKLILGEGEILDEKLVEKHIGISKEYNVFELQKAIGSKDQNSAMKITYYMSKNPKNNPLVQIIGNLYNFFSNVILYHTMVGQPPQTIASTLGINPYFIKDYDASARFYPLKHATRVISILREFDLKNKGLGANQTNDSELLKEMVYKILNVHLLKI